MVRIRVTQFKHLFPESKDLFFRNELIVQGLKIIWISIMNTS